MAKVESIPVREPMRLSVRGMRVAMHDRMNIAIECTTNEGCRFYTLATDKHQMSVSVCRSYLSVCFHNAAASLNRNLGGKVFHGDTMKALNDALTAYKSEAAKAMIQAVIDAEYKILLIGTRSAR